MDPKSIREEPRKGRAARRHENAPYAYGRWVTEAGNPIPIRYSDTPYQIEAIAETSNLLRRLTQAR